MPPPYERKTEVVITQQPTAVVSGSRNGDASDNFFILSIVLSVLCCVCGSWVALCCTIPAIFYAANVSANFDVSETSCGYIYYIYQTSYQTCLCRTTLARNHCYIAPTAYYIAILVVCIMTCLNISCLLLCPHPPPLPQVYGD